MGERQVGQLIANRYRLTEKLNAGGMGQIFKAVDTQLFQRTVAVKLLTLWGSDKMQEELRRRFAEEAQVSVMLGEHPCIIHIMDYGIDHDQPYLVMEYLGAPPKGWDLSELLRLEGGMEPSRVVNLARQICAGLQFAHEFVVKTEGRCIQGVIHRDIKPSNLFVINEKSLGETAKILDFGIAKVLSDVTVSLGTQTGFLGTPVYASPEQLRGELLTPQSDIYSLGMVLYQMLSGQLPLKPATKSFPGWYEAHNYKDPQPLSQLASRYPLPGALEAVIMSCLKKDPRERPQSMAQISTQLEQAIQGATPGQTLTATNSTLTAQLPTTRRQPYLSAAQPFSPAALAVGSLSLPQPTLDQLQTLLVKLVGPVGTILLQQTLAQSSTSQELVEQLTQELPSGDRTRFRQTALELLREETYLPSQPYPSEPPTPQPSQPSALQPEFINSCEQHLTQLVGPIAALVMQQVLSQSPSLTPMQLVDALSEEIPHPQKAREFRQKMLTCLP
ncbi:MAG: serine/threonine protein kinase [Synechococcaceae cyanobacterium SM2_3_1]|nr:serine/threonine protein kinase [Synechococcaceae cyanobacterium SM2_3_1]